MTRTFSKAAREKIAARRRRIAEVDARTFANLAEMAQASNLKEDFAKRAAFARVVINAAKAETTR